MNATAKMTAAMMANMGRFLPRECCHDRIPVYQANHACDHLEQDTVDRTDC
jgi:hypothetical protein